MNHGYDLESPCPSIVLRPNRDGSTAVICRGVDAYQLEDIDSPALLSVIRTLWPEQKFGPWQQTVGSVAQTRRKWEDRNV